MKLLVGLGNPGDRYAATRHNIGFQVAAETARRHRISLKKKGFQGLYGVGRVAGVETMILLPQTFMNRSGESVQAAYRSLGILPGDLTVIFDDLDLPYGRLRIRSGGGHGGHNGLKDILAALGTGDFVRLRIGIGRPEHQDVTGHVLSRFSSEEQKSLPRLLEAASGAVAGILAEGALQAMNDYNHFNLFD